MNLSSGSVRPNMIAHIKKLLPLRFGLMNVLFLTFFFVFNGLSVKRGLINLNYMSASDYLDFCFSCVTLMLAVQIVNMLTESKRILRVCCNLGLFTVFFLLITYHWKTGSPFFFSVIKDNISLIFDWDSLSLILYTIGWKKLVVLAGIIVISLITEIKWRTLSCTAQYPPLLPKLIVAILLYLLIMLYPYHYFDDIAFFMLSVDKYFESGNEIPAVYPSDMSKQKYPFIRKYRQDDNPALGTIGNKPNIFLIVIESFNANYVSTKNPEGREYTPIFNSLINKGIYVEKFYGNSVQTAKGHMVIVASILPSYRSKVFTNYPDICLNTLPDILSNEGYETIFFQAQEHLNFDNTLYFNRKHGFRKVETVFNYLSDEEKKRIWGWGTDDKPFYQHFFKFLDKQREKILDKKTPFFVMLATIGTHMPFDQMPRELFSLYKSPKNMKERYANHIHLADKALGVFIEEITRRDYLKNSIVVITGDHSFPIGENGIFHNEIGAYEANFRTPLLILWEKHLIPQRISGVAFSQVDIAPTLLNLANIKLKRTHFVGTSIFSTTKNYVYLIQPYSGTYIGVIDYPYKYLFNMAEKKELLFNVEKDSLEENNLINNMELSDIKMRLQRQINFIYLNQYAIQHNLFWDCSEVEKVH